MEVNPGGGRGHSQRGRNVSHGSVGVVVQDDGRTLAVGELTEQRHELVRSLLGRIGHVWDSIFDPPAPLELSGGDAEGDPPDPRERIG